MLGVLRLGWVIAVLAGGAISVALFGSCDDETSGGGGSGGELATGGCPVAYAPNILRVTAVSGSLPPDTRIVVAWSGNEEPPFQLDDPKTYLTIDESNLVCDVEGPEPPTDLAELTCQVWTNGATEVEVTAAGYLPIVETFAPTFIDECDVASPAEAEMILEIDVDAGMP